MFYLGHLFFICLICTKIDKGMGVSGSSHLLGYVTSALERALSLTLYRYKFIEYFKLSDLKSFCYAYTFL